MNFWISICALLFISCGWIFIPPFTPPPVIPPPPLSVSTPLTCSDDPCVVPLAEAELQATSDRILLQIPTEAVVLFWLADTQPIDRFEPPTGVDTEAPYEFFPTECGYVVDVLVILPVETPQDTGGARRLLQAEVVCETP